MHELNNVLVVADDERANNAVLECARMLASHHDAKLTIVDVKAFLDSYTEALVDIMPKDELRALVIKHRTDQLQRLLDQHDSLVSQTAEVKVFDGVPFIEVIREVLRNDHDMIVKLPDSDIQPTKRLFGSTDMHLMRKSPVPVWMLHPDKPDPPKRVTVAIDVLTVNPESADFNHRLLHLAKQLCALSDAELHILSAWQLVGEETMRHSPFLKIEEVRIKELLEHTQQRTTDYQTELVRWFTQQYRDVPAPTCHCIKGNPREVLPDFINEQDIDLMVLGTVGRTGIPGLLIGNTAESVLSEVDCSVLTVKPRGFVTPVAE